METTLDMVKELRERTGAGMLDCKHALEAAQGDLQKAAELLRKKGFAIAAKKAGRVAREGVIDAYVHPGERLAALIELNCETDFVARTEEFRRLAHDIAMQVVATDPKYITSESIPEEVLEAQRETLRQQMRSQGKPEHLLDRIVQGMMKRYYDEVCLLQQPFIKDDKRSVGDIITEKVAQLGENIVVSRFVRFQLGDK